MAAGTGSRHRFLWASIAPFLSEAVAAREWRRVRRWLGTSSVPALYVLGTVFLPWVVVPAVYSSAAALTFGGTVRFDPPWMFMTLALTLVGGAMAAAFTRVSQVWHTERVRKTLESWFLSGQEPRSLVLTVSLSGAALALLVSLPSLLLLLGTGLFFQVPAVRVLLTVLLLVVSAGFAAFAASAAFFATVLSPEEPGKAGEQQTSSPPGLRLSGPVIAAGVILALILALWLRIEAVERGWSRPWEEHPARLMLAVGLWTPAPVLIGLVNRRWWVSRVLDRLDVPISPEVAALLLVLLYGIGILLFLRWATRSYQLLRIEPERDRLSRPATPAEEVTAESAGGYWGGFANPVWTREIRTRLRGREAPQFIFFASVALAIGGFTPLVSAAGQLSDPLETARVAREVFFWLALTLTAMIALVAPGLTAEAITAERTRGTLEMLLATPLRRHEILRGKLLGDLSVLGLLISPSLPLFGFCYLFHGASGPQVVGVFILLAIITLLGAGAGICASALHSSTMAAKWQAYLLSLLFLVGGPLELMYGLASMGGVPAGGSLLILVPGLLMAAYGFILSTLWDRACQRLQYMDESAGG